MTAACFKPIPDEEGTEIVEPVGDEGQALGFKPIPDEEGTEMLKPATSTNCMVEASNRSPMRRGLKCQRTAA